MKQHLLSPLTNALLAGLTPAPVQRLDGAQAADAPQFAEELSLIRFFKTNEKGRDFVVGDLHGCYDMLMKMLDDIGFNREVDRLFCTGDLADRGPDSVKCIRLLAEPWFFSVAGNHEEMVLRAAFEKNFDWQWWISNGGAWATAISPDELFELAALVAELPLAIVVGEGAERFNIVHAEWYRSDVALEDVLSSLDSSMGVPLCLTWGRELIEGKMEPDHEDLSLTFVGHTPVEQVSRIGNMIYLDTGAYKAHFWRDSDPADIPHAMTIIEPKGGAIYRSHGQITLAPAA